jgi:molecular chaperone GrpE
VPEPTLQDIADRIDDVGRLVSRQAATLGSLADARATGPDVPLLVELLALCSDTRRCAATARSRRERAAFEAIAAGLERLLAGRGGTIVTPAPGDPFTGATMEAAEVVATHVAGADRTVAVVLAPGLEVGGRSVRPARVAVHRVR